MSLNYNTSIRSVTNRGALYMTEYKYQNALFLQVWSIHLITVFVRRMNGEPKHKLLDQSHDHLIGHFSDTCSSFGPQKTHFYLSAVHKEVYSPTDELVFSRKVEVTVHLQVSCPPLHPLLLDVCVKGKHLLAHKKYLQFRFMF